MEEGLHSSLLLRVYQVMTEVEKLVGRVYNQQALQGFESCRNGSY